MSWLSVLAPQGTPVAVVARLNQAVRQVVDSEAFRAYALTQVQFAESSTPEGLADYMARDVAKNVVASGLAEKCEIQLAYAIGVSEPVSVHVDTFGTGKIPDNKMAAIVRKTFPLTPSGIIKHLDLRRPIFQKTASGGHFGRSEESFTWEKTDKAGAIREAAGV